jgi:hypothetical protein
LAAPKDLRSPTASIALDGASRGARLAVVAMLPMFTQVSENGEYFE